MYSESSTSHCKANLIASIATVHSMILNIDIHDCQHSKGCSTIFTIDVILGSVHTILCTKDRYFKSTVTSESPEDLMLWEGQYTAIEDGIATIIDLKLVCRWRHNDGMPYTEKKEIITINISSCITVVN